jgi:hypothetical protein
MLNVNAFVTDVLLHISCYPKRSMYAWLNRAKVRIGAAGTCIMHRYIIIV